MKGKRGNYSYRPYSQGQNPIKLFLEHSFLVSEIFSLRGHPAFSALVSRAETATAGNTSAFAGQEILGGSRN